MSVHAANLRLAFGRQVILDNLDLTLPERGIVGITGPSGCGKTTLLHVLAGLLPLDGGSVAGLARGRVGVVFQEDRLLPWLTAADNLDLLIRNRELTFTWLERLNMAQQADQYPAELSGGMKRRIALARALVFDCDLLLLDEPFQGLDDLLKSGLYLWIRQAAETKPVMLVSHDWAEISRLADRIYLAAGPPLTLTSTK